MSKTVQVLDPATGTVSDVAPDAAEQGFRAGKSQLLPGTEIPVIGADGTVGYIPAEKAAQALTDGMRFASGKDIARHEAEKNPGRAFVENFANNLLPVPGLVHAGMRGLGADADDLAARAETTAGQWGSGLGFAGGMLLPVGLAAKAAGGVAARVAGNVGLHAAEEAATKAAYSAIGSVTERELARKALSAGMGTAVSGAAIGVGDVIDEAALGRADLNAETLLFGAGSGALIGGLTGGAAKALGLGVKAGTKALAERTPQWLEKAAGKIEHTFSRPGQAPAQTSLPGMAQAVARTPVEGNPILGYAAGSLLGGPVGGAVGAVLARPQAVADGLRGLGAVIEGTQKAMASRVAKLAGHSGPAYGFPVTSTVARSTQRMLEGSADERQAAFEERADELAALADPSRYTDHAAPQLESFAAAPNHQAEIATQGQKVLAYLSGQLPAQDIGASGRVDALFGKAPPRGRADDRAIRDFAELDKLAQSPTYIFDLADRGVVRATHMRALETLYPNMTANIRRSLVEMLPSGKKHTAAQKRSIRVMLGADVVDSRYRSVRQAVYAPPAATPPPAAAPSASPVPSLASATDALTTSYAPKA